MEASIKSHTLHINGMTCTSCQHKIETTLGKKEGIRNIKVSCSKGTAEITYDPEIITLAHIQEAIMALGYQIKEDEDKEKDTLDAPRIIGLLVFIIALFFFLQQLGVLNLLAPSQLAETNMSYGMLFIIGLLTSVHCIAMCGGINISQTLPKNINQNQEKKKGKLTPFRSTFLYNLGRVISYTAVGFMVGALGSVITFSNTVQGGLKLIAGIFMVLMGLNLLGIFPGVGKLIPRMPRFFASKINAEKEKSKSPLIVGLLNGLMPCGPLQAMQLYALSTGSPLAGALSMFLFSLGTVPLMFGLGALSSFLSKRFTKKMVMIGAILVAVLGLSMFSQGLNLAGISLSGQISQGTGTAADDTQWVMEDGRQVVRSTLSSGRYPEITVAAGTPVKWIIDAPKGSINGCNNRIFIREYGIEHSFKTGENIIEFTPTQTGTIPYSCWMGMINGTIHVVEEGTDIKAVQPTVSEANKEPTPAGVAIPAEQVQIAEIGADDYGEPIQKVRVELTEAGFTPGILVVRAGMDTQWTVINKGGPTDLLVPSYNARLTLPSGETPLYVYPTKSFDFSTGDNVFYGYVKVVDDLETVDVEGIKEEVRNYEPLIYPPNVFTGNSGSGASCH